MRPALLPLLLGLAGCASSYDPCFLPPSLVSDLRILGVRADPPEVVYDAQSFSSGVVVVSALLARPQKGASRVEVRLRACVPQASGRCPAEQPWELSSLGDDDNPAEFALQIQPALVQAALAADPLHGYGGVRVQLEVQGFTSDGPGPQASKLLLMSPAAPGHVPNHSFEVTGLAFVNAGLVRHAPTGAEVTLDVGGSVGLRPLLAPTPGVGQPDEEYDVVDLLGRTQHLRERISYSFYVTPHAQFGAVGHPQAGQDVADEPGPGEAQPPAGLVQLSPLGETVGRVWVVARDGRGGEAWSWAQLTLQDPRDCVLIAGGEPVHYKCGDLEIGCQ